MPNHLKKMHSLLKAGSLKEKAAAPEETLISQYDSAVQDFLNAPRSQKVEERDGGAAPSVGAATAQRFAKPAAGERPEREATEARMFEARQAVREQTGNPSWPKAPKVETQTPAFAIEGKPAKTELSPEKIQELREKYSIPQRQEAASRGIRESGIPLPGEVTQSEVFSDELLADLVGEDKVKGDSILSGRTGQKPLLSRKEWPMQRIRELEQKARKEMSDKVRVEGNIQKSSGDGLLPGAKNAQFPKKGDDVSGSGEENPNPPAPSKRVVECLQKMHKALKLKKSKTHIRSDSSED